MPTAYSVVLQMPRGNLETIYPRALVLAAIRRRIEACQYREAFLACRNQRVDMNILHDHDPELFLANVENIIGQLKRIDYIDLLLSQLRYVRKLLFVVHLPNSSRDEDVSETMYKETLKAKDLVNKPTISQAQIDTKVNRICDAFLAVLEQPRYRDEHLQNIITSHVSKVPPALEAGLEMIGRLQGRHDQAYWLMNSLTDL